MMLFLDQIYIFISIVLEAFPISSSGHSQLFCSITNYVTTYVCNKSFDLVLHGPIAFIIPWYFFNDWILIIRQFPRTLGIIKKIFYNGLIIDSITVGAYFLFFKNNQYLPLWLGFVITSATLISLLWCPNYTSIKKWSSLNSVILGCVQAFSLTPGISRLGVTYATACWMGAKPLRAFQVSFLIELPISCAAFLKGVYEVKQENKIFELLQLKVILVMLIATICSFFCLKFTQKVLVTHSWVFSMYVIIVAMISLIV